MIQVEHENTDLLKKWGLDNIQEHCIFCGEITKYWHRATNKPVCQKCSETHNVEDIKTVLMQGGTLTEEDINSIKYFILEKGDITKWCDWKTKKHLVYQLYPELIKALDNLMIAEKTLKIIVSNLGD